MGQGHFYVYVNNIKELNSENYGLIVGYIEEEEERLLSLKNLVYREDLEKRYRLPKIYDVNK